MIILAWILSVFTQLSFAGPQEFPIGIYSIEDDSHLVELKNSGFSVIHISEQEPDRLNAIAKKAESIGLKYLAYPDKVRSSTWSTSKNSWHPKAWYIFDEPDVHRKTAKEICSLNKSIKSWSPNIKTALAVGQGSAVQTYASCADIIMVDWYPVPHLPLESVITQIKLARKYAGSKPVWAILQAFDWREYRQKSPTKPRVGRFPTFSEIRFMTYAAILHGVDGIFYFKFAMPGRRTLLEYPEKWQALLRVVSELNAFKPILQGGKPIPPPVETKIPHMEIKAWRYNLRDYVVIINTDGKEKLKLPTEMLTPEWRLLFEGKRNLEVWKATVKDAYLLPYRVLVFESRMKF